MTRHQKKLYKACEYCGKEFYTTQCYANKKYCNAECMAAAFRRPPSNCAHCGKEYKPVGSKQIYCSRKCGTDSQNTRVTKACLQCGKEYQVREYRANTTRFCSQACGGRWHILNHPMNPPDITGNTLRKGLRPVNAFTSEQVSGKNNPRWVESIKMTCQQCGEEFERKPNEVNRKDHKYLFCSIACRVENFKTARAGENSPRWVGGPKTYRGRGWKKTRLLAVARDNGTCQDCGKVIGNSIPVHHRRPFREFASAEEANHLDNLICYCQSCHMKNEHKQFAL